LYSFLVRYRFTGGDFRITLCPSVHKTGSRDNLKSTENIFLKLDIWIDGSMEIMHVFFFSSYVENMKNKINKERRRSMNATPI
jgi:hypothetical protein